MQIVMTLIVGLVAGALAKLAIPGKERGGLVVAMAFGVAGSFIAGMLGHSFGWYRVGEGLGLLASLTGAIVLLTVYRIVLDRHVSRAWPERAR